MASKMIAFIIIAALIARAAAEPPVMIDERHLRPSEDQQISANGWQDSVPGIPGRDYPNLTTIPRTSFSCAGKTPGGYYADVETRCQVFHVCNTQGDKSSFLCPSGSIFNQRHFVCDWWYDFECEQAPELYSLNKGLDDNNSDDKSESVSSSLSDRPSIEDERRYEDSSASVHDSPPLQYNSLAGSGGDLSLASSGYANNIRDEANSIYEDYTSGKIPDVSVTAAPSTVRPSSTSPTTVHHHSASTASGVSSSTDNYSSTHRKEPTYDRSTEAAGRLNGLSAEQTSTPRYQARNYENNRQSSTYRRRPSQGRDIMPRGFSKSRAEEQLNRNNQGAGLFVNDGLSIDEFERIQNSPFSRENNNYIDNNNYNSEASNNVNSNYNNNFNNNHNKHNNNNNNNNNKHQNQYQNSNRGPLPQENNNYINDNNNNYKNNNYNNKNNFNNQQQTNNNNNFSNHQQTNNNNNFNNNQQPNNNNNFNNNQQPNNNKNFNNNQQTKNNNNFNNNQQPNNNNNFNNNQQTKNNNNFNNNQQPNNNNNFNNNQQTNNNINSNYQATSNSNSNHQKNNNFNDYQNNNDYKADYQSNHNANTNRVDKNFYNRNTINSNEQQNSNSNEQHNSNSYEQQNSNSYEQQNSNSNNISYENKQQKTETTESILTKNFVFPESHYEHNLETPTEDPPSVFSNPSEDDVDRERQREVDSVDLKKQRPSWRHFSDDYSTPSFIIREESSNNSPVWRDDLSTSSSDKEKPPYPTVGSSLAKPEEATTPIAVKRQRSREYLGRRPQGGLPGGSGSGVPGANRVLVASDNISGKSAEDSSTNKLPTSGEGSVWDRQEGYDSGSRGYEGGNESSNGVDRSGQYWNKGQWNEGRQ